MWMSGWPRGTRIGAPGHLGRSRDKRTWGRGVDVSGMYNVLYVPAGKGDKQRGRAFSTTAWATVLLRLAQEQLPSSIHILGDACAKRDFRLLTSFESLLDRYRPIPMSLPYLSLPYRAWHPFMRRESRYSSSCPGRGRMIMGVDDQNWYS